MFFKDMGFWIWGKSILGSLKVPSTIEYNKDLLGNILNGDLGICIIPGFFVLWDFL